MKTSLKFLAVIFFVQVLALTHSDSVQAQNLYPGQGFLLAADDPDESYDPFADYSEFDENSEEESDIQFFRHGRLLTVGLMAGMRGFTQNLAKLYSTGPTYGLFLSFFTDLRMAFQLGFMTGDYTFSFTSPSSRIGGSVSFTFLSLDLKYYLNTQNLTRGLGDLNPYLIGGFSQVYRSYAPSDSGVDLSKESVIGVNGGLGIEIPITRKKSFFGIQGVYRYFSFRDESSPFLMPDLNANGPVPNGDSYDLMGILGFNF